MRGTSSFVESGLAMAGPRPSVMRYEQSLVVNLNRRADRHDTKQIFDIGVADGDAARRPIDAFGATPAETVDADAPAEGRV